MEGNSTLSWVIDADPLYPNPFTQRKSMDTKYHTKIKCISQKLYRYNKSTLPTSKSSITAWSRMKSETMLIISALNFWKMAWQLLDWKLIIYSPYFCANHCLLLINYPSLYKWLFCVLSTLSFFLLAFPFFGCWKPSQWELYKTYLPGLWFSDIGLPLPAFGVNI